MSDDAEQTPEPTAECVLKVASRLVRLSGFAYDALARATAFAALCLALVSLNRWAIAFEPAQVNVDLDRPISGYALVDAFPGLTFDQPVAVASPPGDTNRLFIVERPGVIVVITNLAAPTRTVFLDLHDSTTSDYIESGLLGLAFHPNYQTNGQFFVIRMVFDKILTERLSRFTVDANDPNRAASSETILIDQFDASQNHNGGDLHFGPDGYLYFSIGDELPPIADRRVLPQAIDGGLFGGIFRIDVDQRPGNPPPNLHSSVVGNYSVPSDNPFIGATSFLGVSVDPAHVRTEYYAVGLRNPWRFSIDDPTGDLFAGDVGADWSEEIDLIRKGSNYGWPYVEGQRPHELTPPDQFDPTAPIFSYGRGEGSMEGGCVVGGFVCRNMSIQELNGWYIFGDEHSGNVWRMRLSDSNTVECIAREAGLVAFGRDPATADLLVASFNRGQIRRLTFVPPTENRVPPLLSETGVFTNLTTLEPATGFVPYEINVPFWSDNAIKSRWFGLMFPESKITFSPTNNWSFPRGSVWVKHFELEMERGNRATATRIETRLLLKSDKEFYGFTYHWNKNGTDAELVGATGLQEPFVIKDTSGVLRTQVWIYPARGDCIACHTPVGGGPLGFNTAQLNLDQMHSEVQENQIQALIRAGYLEAENIDPNNLPVLAPATDVSAPVEYRVKSYLAANCSQCHQPGGIWDAIWDARLLKPMTEANIVNAESLAPFTSEAKIVAPRSLTNSMIYWRLTHQEVRMPRIGSTVLDDAARDLLTDWILGMPDAAFTDSEVGLNVAGGRLTGSTTQHGNVRVVSGIGTGMNGLNDRLHFLSTTLGRGGHVIAHITGAPGTRPAMQAGVMVRESNDPDAPAIWLSRNNNNQNTLIARIRGQAASNVALGSQERPWMRLVRAGDQISAWESADGAAWQKVGAIPFAEDGDVLAGVAVASGEDWRFATVEFDNFQALSVSLQLKDPAPDTPLPRDLFLDAIVMTNGAAVSRVDFVADGQVVGSAFAPPYQLLWTNAWAGSYDIVAIAVDQNGLTVGSEPTPVNLVAGAPIAHASTSIVTPGNWRASYGLLGFAIPEVVTNLPARVGLTFANSSTRTYSTSSLLTDANGTFPATAWRADNELAIAYRPGNEIPHRLTLFFAPYDITQSATVVFTDPSSGDILDQQSISQFENGRFVSWTVRGDVDIEIRSAPGQPAVLSGVFLDALAGPTVRLLPIASPVTLPKQILLQAEGSVEGRAVSRVEFWDGATKIGEATQQPFEFAWANALAGDHSLTAVAIGEYGLSTRSQPVPLTCLIAQSGATFLAEDRSTQGQWIGPYGNGGQLVVGGWTNLPATVNTSVKGTPYGFAEGDTTNRFSLQIKDTIYRIAACYYANVDDSIEIRVTAGLGEPTRMSLYFLDWLQTNRVEEIQITDAGSGVILDRRVIDSFGGGVYLTWNITGDVLVRIRSLNDFNVVVSGIFFDSAEPELRLMSSTNQVTLPADLTLRAELLIRGKTADRIDFFSDQQLIGSATNSPYELVWTNTLAGEHTVYARASGYRGGNPQSPPITINCNLPQAQVTFTGLNGLIKGNWWKAFGADGFEMPVVGSHLRSFGRVTLGSDVGVHEWAPPGDDQRAVYAPDLALYQPACWFAPSAFDAVVDFLDGREHPIALYFVDFERAGAAQTLRVLDAESGAVLDEHTLDDMGEGVYLSWNGQGHLRFHIDRLTEWSAISSGIFIGGSIPNSQFWWARNFGDLLATPNWTDDPDNDGRPNAVEYALGTDPHTADPPLAIQSSLSGRFLRIDLPGSQASGEVTLSAETSTDLVNWQPAALTRADTDEYVRLTTPVLETGPHFYRLRFQLP